MADARLAESLVGSSVTTKFGPCSERRLLDPATRLLPSNSTADDTPVHVLHASCSNFPFFSGHTHRSHSGFVAVSHRVLPCLCNLRLCIGRTVMAPPEECA